MTSAEPGAYPVRGPVFVGGTGRSGTTIVGELIGASQHYALYHMESRFQADPSGLADLAQGRVGFDEFKELMVGRWFHRPPNPRGPRGVHTIISRDTLDAALERLRSELDDDPWPAAGRFLHAVLDPVATQAGKETWVEMTPPNAERMNDLARMLPAAKFINMVRDGRAVAHSVAKKRWGPNDFEGALEWWSSQVIAATHASREVDPDRVLTMRLESLTGESREDAYTRLASFLAADEDTAMREFFETRVTGEKAHEDRWSRDLDEERMAQVQELYATHLQGLLDAGAGLPKPDLEEVPGEVELMPTAAATRSTGEVQPPSATPHRPATSEQTAQVAPPRPTKRERQERSARRHNLFDGSLRNFRTGTLIDLGAGHGGYSRRAADAGWQVTAVDARDERFPNDDRITWVRQDVREVDLSGYDLILCLGLFYHLTLDDQLDLLKRTSGTPLILDTHVATDQPTHQLSDPIEDRGYTGRYYSEKGWQTRATASWNNTQSFWPTPETLYRMLADHGYPAVFAGTPWVTTDRTFFVCVPAGS